MKRIWLIALGIGFQCTLWANLVVNGDFEAPLVHNPSDAFDVYNGGQSFAGWTVGGHSIDIVSDNPALGGNWWVAASGHQSVDLNGYGRGSISQNLATDQNQTYYLSFAMAGNPFATVVWMDFFWANGQVARLSFDVSKYRSDPGWNYFEFVVTAPSTSAQITFTSLIEGSNGPAIDDVVVGKTPRPFPFVPSIPPTPPGPATPVPEPSTYIAGALLLLPFGMQSIRRL